MPSFNIEFQYYYPGMGENHSGSVDIEFSDDESQGLVYRRYHLSFINEVERAYGLHPDYLEHATSTPRYPLHWVMCICLWNILDEFNGSFYQDVFHNDKSQDFCISEIIGPVFKQRIDNFWEHKPASQ